MRSIGGPLSDRNVLGRWQDRRENRLGGPMGEARQASWFSIALLLVATIAVASAIWFAYLFLQEETGEPTGPRTPAAAIR